MSELAPEKIGPWTFEDLQALPESAWRYEIVDGSLVMSPSPGFRHEVVSALLLTRLNTILAPSRFVLGPMSVNMHPSYRIPDLVVVDRATIDGDDVPLLQVSDVDLVIEIVSPGSLTTDRVTKPAQYAAVGLPAFWRVETAGGVSVTAYVLRRPGDTVYAELGTWGEGDTLRVTEPFDLELRIADITP